MQKIGRQSSEHARPLDKYGKSCWTHLRCKRDGPSLSDCANLVFPTAPEQVGPSGKSHGPGFLCVTAIPDHQPVQGWADTPNVTVHMAVVYRSLCWIPGWGSLTVLQLFSDPHPDLGWDSAHRSIDKVPCQTQSIHFCLCPLAYPRLFISHPTETFAPDGREHHPASTQGISLSHQNESKSRTLGLGWIMAEPCIQFPSQQASLSGVWHCP